MFIVFFYLFSNELPVDRAVKSVASIWHRVY